MPDQPQTPERNRPSFRTTLLRVIAVQVSQQLAHLRTHAALTGDGERVDHAHLQAQ